MQKPHFANNQIYHIYNRGVDKRTVFLDDADYFRAVHNLFEFNDEMPAANLYYKLPHLQSYEVQLRKITPEKQSRTPRKLIVEILAFCLMPNHFHLLIRQRKEQGVVKFMQKFGTGYTNYFNKKYERSGALFQGRYKGIRVENDAHLLHLPYYIHFNPLDLKFPEWRERTLKNYRGAMEFLENYRWSSFQDYIGKHNFPSVTQREFLLKFYQGPENYKQDSKEWLQHLDLASIQDITLE